MRENYVVMPALVHCDYAILQSYAIMKLYQSLLEKECGKEYAGYWEEKLLPLGSALFDKTEKEEHYGSHAIWEHLKGEKNMYHLDPNIQNLHRIFDQEMKKRTTSDWI